MRTPRILALIPTISPTRIMAAGPWLSALRAPAVGIDARIVANAASVAAHRAAWGAPVIDTGANPGFARSISAAARSVDGWDWVLLLNDDLVLGTETPARLRDAVRAADVDGTRVLFFDPEPPRPLPDRRGVFVSLSLAEAVAARFGRAARRSSSGGAAYKSFSAVAIHRDVWDACGGLDERFVFCFEDAYFVRRHLDGDGVEPRSVDVGLSHEKSTSTSRHIARVLPAIAFSARTYLHAIGTPAFASDTIVVAALVLRAALVPFASAPPREHFRGVARAMRAIVQHREPALPPYDQL